MNISSQYPIFSQLLKENLFPWLPIFNDIIIVCFFINLSGHRLASSILEENVDLEVHRMGKIITKFFLLETLFLASPDKWHFNRHEIRPDKWPKACMCVQTRLCDFGCAFSCSLLLRSVRVYTPFDTYRDIRMFKYTLIGTWKIIGTYYVPIIFEAKSLTLDNAKAIPGGGANVPISRMFVNEQGLPIMTLNGTSHLLVFYRFLMNVGTLRSKIIVSDVYGE